VQLILSQICWLDSIVNGAALSGSMIEILNASPESVQREIILRLPEIVDAAHQSKLAMPLRDIMETSKGELTNYVLEAFTALAIDAEALEEVRQSMLKRLALVAMCDVPVVVKFLLDTTPAGKEGEVVREMREQLDLTTERKLTTQATQSAATQQQRRKGKKEDVKDVDTMTLRIIR
jgi:hypothetical protein